MATKLENKQIILDCMGEVLDRILQDEKDPSAFIAQFKANLTGKGISGFMANVILDCAYDSLVATGFVAEEVEPAQEEEAPEV